MLAVYFKESGHTFIQIMFVFALKQIYMELAKHSLICFVERATVQAAMMGLQSLNEKIPLRN